MGRESPPYWNKADYGSLETPPVHHAAVLPSKPHGEELPLASNANRKIPKAREVRLTPKIRKVLEARCRAPSTGQRDVKRARIVLLAAEGRSTRSIAEEVGVQPRIVSNWRRHFAEHGLGGLKDRPRAGKKLTGVP